MGGEHLSGHGEEGIMGAGDLSCSQSNGEDGVMRAEVLSPHRQPLEVKGMCDYHSLELA